MGKIFRKFGLLLWKNILVRRRHWFLTLLEFLIPVLLFIILAVLRSQTNGFSPFYVDHPTTFLPTYEKEVITSLSARKIAYAPYNNFTEKLMNKVLKKLNSMRYQAAGLIPCKDEAKLESVYRNILANTSSYSASFCGVVFEGNIPDVGLPKSLSYKIRMPDHGWSSTVSLFPMFAPSGPGYGGSYFYQGFLGLQLVIDKSFIEEAKKGSPYLPGINMQKFPYPPYVDDRGFSTITRIILPLLTVLSFLMLSPSIIKRIVEEKETGVKELMKMMGLKSWELWLGWLFNALLVNIVSISIIVILLKVSYGDGGILNLSDGFLLWIFLLFYAISATVFCFAISSFFNHPTLATTCGVILWNVTYSAPAFSLMDRYEYLSFSAKMSLGLLPNMAVHWGYQVIAGHEATNTGLQWDNLFKPTVSTDNITMAHVFLMFIIDIFLYGAITWYIESVKPGKYGVAKPWYFIFMIPFFCKRKVDSDDNFSGANNDYLKCFEMAINGLKAGIRIKNLKKSFAKFGGKSVVAVDGVSLDIYEGEITVLLGHNGAGKTTTMSILTGLFSPTNGSVTINGYDIAEDMDNVREGLGLCPQHNLLFNDLTVEEHLLLFGMLKGKSKQEAREEATILLSTMGLSEKAKCNASTLSGGMKRKLSLGIALIGDSKVVILDEPTSGLDPEARRQIWDLLLGMRGKRTILITTHFMEEADVLGDRIAIMSHGQVKCYGTSMFLKKLYGAGYHLTVSKGSTCDVKKLREIIQRLVPDSSVKYNTDTDVTYILPSDHSEKFSELFLHLENCKEELGIHGIGVSITTMEEVFIKSGETSEEDGGSNRSLPSESLAGSQTNLEASHAKRRTGLGLVVQQYLALLLKRIKYTYRRWIIFIPQALIPIVIMIVAVYTSTVVTEQPQAAPPLKLMLDIYGHANVLYEAADKNQGSCYESVLMQNREVTIINSNNVNAELIERGKADLGAYRRHYITAASLQGFEATALFSTVALHSSPISLNLVTNSLLQCGNKSYGQISVTNHPLPEDARWRYGYDDSISSLSIGLIWMFLPPVGLLMLVTCFIIFPLVERVSKVKQLQLMTGTSPLLYWSSCFTWDYACYFIICILIVAFVPVADGIEAFSYANELAVLFVILILYGLGMIPLTYIFSYFRNTAAGGFALMTIINLILGIVLTLTAYLLEVGKEDTTMRFVFELFPHFTLCYSLKTFSVIATANNRCNIIPQEAKEQLCTEDAPAAIVACCENLCTKHNNCLEPKPYMVWTTEANNGLLIEVVYFLVDALVYAFILFLIEYGLFGKIYLAICKKIWGERKEWSATDQDDDVVKESSRVLQQITSGTRRLNSHSDVLLVEDLKKNFRSFPAVKGVQFGVGSGQCFGLLGVNGAGKTTTFRMLTGDEYPSSGNAYVSNYSLEGYRKKYLSKIGYCPQFDAIIDVLTGNEMLRLFANLHGIPAEDVENEVRKWITAMDLNEYADRQCGTYSGGNKRKLSTAMALIGDLPIIFLDEPTSGVDPVARRNLWGVLQKSQKAGQAIVLTSHSMEECEALCNVLAIMVNGQFMCFGSIQYLKNKYGQGFTILIKLNAASDSRDVETVKHTVEKAFSPCVLKDEHQGLLHYHITDQSFSWGNMFSTMERVKKTFPIIEDYTISQTTLEQVFLSFARKQKIQDQT